MPLLKNNLLLVSLFQDICCLAFSPISNAQAEKPGVSNSNSKARVGVLLEGPLVALLPGAQQRQNPGAAKAEPAQRHLNGIRGRDATEVLGLQGFRFK